MEDENGNGATWDGEKREQEIERVIHLAGGGVKISKVENEAGRWREMVQIGETRWRKRGRCMLGGKCCKRFGGKMSCEIVLIKQDGHMFWTGCLSTRGNAKRERRV